MIYYQTIRKKGYESKMYREPLTIRYGLLPAYSRSMRKC